MDPSGQGPIYSCNHPAYPTPEDLSSTSTRTTADGETRLQGLCRTCHFTHCETTHKLITEYWEGKIEDLKRIVARATLKLGSRYDEEMEKMKNEMEDEIEVLEAQMERELRDIWRDFEVRWGNTWVTDPPIVQR